MMRTHITFIIVIIWKIEVTNVSCNCCLHEIHLSFLAMDMQWLYMVVLSLSLLIVIVDWAFNTSSPTPYREYYSKVFVIVDGNSGIYK